MNPMFSSDMAEARRQDLSREAEEQRRLREAIADVPDCDGEMLNGIGRGAASIVRLRDGVPVGLRTAAPADAPRLRDMFFALSDTTRYLYFSAGVPATEAWAQRVARFDRAPREPVAELGILLADAWQSRGLGRAVVARLRDEALCRGLAGFTALVLGENRRAFRLFRQVFPAMRASLAYGQYELAMPFGPAPSLQSAAR